MKLEDAKKTLEAIRCESRVWLAHDDNSAVMEMACIDELASEALARLEKP